jgi:hypothetical protein
MKDDFEHSRGRWLDQDELRANLTGWGTNRQGHAIRRKYQAGWFGQHLGLKRPSRDLEFRVGAWAIDLLNDQPFAIDKDGVSDASFNPRTR